LKKLKLGLVGLGKHAKNVWLPLLTNNEFFDFTAISSEHTNSDEISKLIKENPSVAVFTNHKDLIKSKLIDCVLISTENHLHGTLVIEALSHQIHVLCEKPLCLETEEISQISELSSNNNTLFFTGFMYRHHPQWKYAKDFFDKIKDEKWLITANFQYSITNEITYIYKNLYRGGALQDAGCYLLDIFDFLKAPEFKKIFKFSEFDSSNKIDLSTRLLLDFGSNQFSDLYCSVNKSKFQEVKIFGENEHITIESPFVIPKNKSTKVIHKEANGKTRTLSFDPTDCYHSELKAFSNSLLNQQVDPLLTDGLNNSSWLIKVLKEKNSNI
jgi:xylose dehydrogenase (NAD/NADP)